MGGNRVLVYNEPDENLFEVLAYTGYDIEMIAELDSASDWFTPDDVDNKPGFFIIESTYHAQFICTSDAHEWDCEFMLDDVREPDNWEWDDIMMFGTLHWPKTVTQEDIERAVYGARDDTETLSFDLLT